MSSIKKRKKKKVVEPPKVSVYESIPDEVKISFGKFYSYSLIYIVFFSLLYPLILMYYLNSNSAYRGKRNLAQRIVDVNNKDKTGVLCGTIRNYNDKHELKSITIRYKMDSQTDQLLEMEENDFWEHFERAKTEYDEERAYFFNKVPGNLVDKVLIEQQATPQQCIPRLSSKDFCPFDNFNFS